MIASPDMGYLHCVSVLHCRPVARYQPTSRSGAPRAHTTPGGVTPAGQAAPPMPQVQHGGPAPNSDLATRDLSVPSSCTDKVKNGDESDVDCGGATCLLCDLGKRCQTDSDCRFGLACDKNVRQCEPAP